MNLKGEPAHVGRHCGSNTYDVDKEVVEFYCNALDDFNPLYAQYAPPLLYHSECYKFVGEWYLANLFGNLHAQQDWELFAPIAVGARVRSRSTIIERFSKRGRDYVINETDICDAESGHLLVRGRTYQSFLPPKDENGEGFVTGAIRRWKGGRGKASPDGSARRSPPRVLNDVGAERRGQEETA